jgi:hypothetical protein
MYNSVSLDLLSVGTVMKRRQMLKVSLPNFKGRENILEIRKKVLKIIKMWGRFTRIESEV